MSDSVMVYATKYRLTMPISVTKGTYRNTGAPGEREYLTKKIVPRAYVEERNAAPNSEFWVIDEEKTKELDAIRQKNIQKQAVEAANKSATMGDLISALGQKFAPAEEVKKSDDKAALEKALARIKELEAEKEVAKTTAEEPTKERFPASDEQVDGKPNASWSLDQLKAYCDEKGIKYHHMTKEAGLLKLIDESK